MALNIALWVSQGLLAVIFVGSGIAKSTMSKPPGDKATAMRASAPAIVAAKRTPTSTLRPIKLVPTWVPLTSCNGERSSTRSRLLMSKRLGQGITI